MTRCIRTRGRDNWTTPKRTVWETERMRGEILPKESERRRSWFRFGRNG